MRYSATRFVHRLVRRALALDELLRTRSPFALVRAVELAERVLVDAPDERTLKSATAERRQG